MTRIGLVDQRELRQASPRSLSAARNSTMLTKLHGALLSVLTTSHFHTSDRRIIRRSIPSGYTVDSADLPRKRLRSERAVDGGVGSASRVLYTRIDDVSIHHHDLHRDCLHRHAVCHRRACASELDETIYRKELRWRRPSTLKNVKTEKTSTNTHQNNEMTLAYFCLQSRRLSAPSMVACLDKRSRFHPQSGVGDPTG
jgi:hypothetical protein